MTAALDTGNAHRRARVIVRPAPRREPPFDDELTDPIPLFGPQDQRLPFAAVPPPLAWRPGTARPRRLPDPHLWGRRLLVGMIETAAGRRPLTQLSPMLSPSIGRGLATTLDRSSGGDARHWLRRATVRTVRATEPADGVAELCATIEVGDRVRAVALRLEEHRGRWRCTRLQLG